MGSRNRSAGLTQGPALVRAGFYNAELGGCPSDAPLLKTLPAVYRPPLRWPERNRGLLATLRARRCGLYPPLTLITQRLVPFGFAGLTSLGIVLETFIGVEDLFARGENKL